VDTTVTATYFITFACYGTYLPGAPCSVDRQHHLYEGPYPNESHSREAGATSLMQHPPYALDETRRKMVLEAIQEVCRWRGWNLLAVHVRSSHVHVVIDADRSAEQVMNALKSYASRALNRSLLDSPGRRRWARHGSTRYLWDADRVSAAVGYVVSGQGETMAAYEQPGRNPAGPLRRRGEIAR
jgi:REP element-mobilizing transposase RayT